MKYSKATNYALHTMVYLAHTTLENTLGVKELAERFQVSSTYLSKVLTTLVKAGLIESVSGVKGGYKLARSSETITFLDVVQAVEGANPLFVCGMNATPAHNEKICLIENAMKEAEQKMEVDLATKTIAGVARQMKSLKEEMKK